MEKYSFLGFLYVPGKKKPYYQEQCACVWSGDVEEISEVAKSWKKNMFTQK